MDHTGENLASELKKVADDCGISEKVSCVVTDNASNIIAAACLTGRKNLPCMTHTLNLIVQESIEGIEDQVVQRMTPELAATVETQQTGDISSPEPAEELQLEHSEPTNIWSMIDERVAASISTRPPTSNSIVTLHTYLEQPNIKKNRKPFDVVEKQHYCISFSF